MARMYVVTLVQAGWDEMPARSYSQREMIVQAQDELEAMTVAESDGGWEAVEAEVC